MSKTILKEETSPCLNCGHPLRNGYRFCPSCGQSTQKEENVQSLISHFLNDYFSFDSKIVRSVKPLIVEPGRLTLEYLAGKRIQYIPPFRLFIFLSIIFFLLLEWFNAGSNTKVEDELLDDSFWSTFFESWLPKLFFLLLPLFALIIARLYRKKAKSLLPHFLFALHYHSSIFLVGIFYILSSWVFYHLEWVIVNQLLLGGLAIYLLVNLWLALKKVYQDSVKKTLWKFILLMISYQIMLVLLTLILVVFSIL